MRREVLHLVFDVIMLIFMVICLGMIIASGYHLGWLVLLLLFWIADQLIGHFYWGE